MTSHAIEFAAVDGYRLHGTLHRPAGAARAAVLIHPATAVPERLYLPFAGYLAEQGFAVLTYDYRGIGRSAPKPLRESKARMRDWMELDVGAATDWARAQFPQLPLLAVGHSVGGHALGISDATRHLHAAVMIASHAGYIGSVTPRSERLRVRLMLQLVGPLATRLFGYMPGSRLGLGEDMPSGVMREWCGWCAKPRYFFDDPSLQALRRFGEKQLPLLAIGFNDDPWANPAAISALVRHFTRCEVQRLQIAPREVGVEAIGHMGFFRRAMAPVLWPMVGEWLSAQIEQRAAA
ncbi:alpha/beta hydrolase family protein [Hydrocarboniphaga sp.]|uniref:alpha/beta hydrolase family protein n=1 Tax=Hydrocarboniphaga sp. TaxID=2033016 RepID=UPI003D0DA3DD